MNKVIAGIAKIIMIREKVARDALPSTKSDYLKGRAEGADYTLSQIKIFFPDEVAQAKTEIEEATNTEIKQ